MRRCRRHCAPAARNRPVPPSGPRMRSAATRRLYLSIAVASTCRTPSGSLIRSDSSPNMDRRMTGSSKARRGWLESVLRLNLYSASQPGRSLSWTLGAGGTTGWSGVSMTSLALKCETVWCNYGVTAALLCAERMRILKLGNNTSRGIAQRRLARGLEHFPADAADGAFEPIDEVGRDPAAEMEAQRAKAGFRAHGAQRRLVLDADVDQH